MAEEVLSLSTTEFDRPRVVIDDESYEMRSDEELSVSLIRQIQALGKKSGSEGASLEERDEAANEMVTLLMPDLPREVLERLTIAQKGKIVTTFNKLGTTKRDDAPSQTD